MTRWLCGLSLLLLASCDGSRSQPVSPTSNAMIAGAWIGDLIALSRDDPHGCFDIYVGAPIGVMRGIDARVDQADPSFDVAFRRHFLLGFTTLHGTVDGNEMQAELKTPRPANWYECSSGGGGDNNHASLVGASMSGELRDGKLFGTMSLRFQEWDNDDEVQPVGPPANVLLTFELRRPD